MNDLLNEPNISAKKRVFKIYPRHHFDIRIRDILATLCSYCLPLHREQLEHAIHSFWPVPKQVKIGFTVRTSLDLVLSALHLPHDSEVIMSAINIQDMKTIVESHHLKVIPIDFSMADLAIAPEKLEMLISAQTKVCLIAQLFGAIVDLEPLAKVCRKYDLLLIEDCAQAFCGKQYPGSPWADISLFSFGPIKSSTALGGAVMVSHSPDLLRNIAQVERTYPAKGEGWFFKRLWKYLFLKLMSVPVLYGLFIRALRAWDVDIEHSINHLSRSFSTPDILSNIRFRPPVHLLYLLKRRLSTLNDAQFEQREKASRRFLAQLPEQIIIPGKHADRNSFWVVPILFDDGEEVQKYLLSDGFDSTRGRHSQIVIPVQEARHPAHTVENAERLIHHVIYLPPVVHMREKEQNRLISSLTNCYEMRQRHESQ